MLNKNPRFIRNRLFKLHESSYLSLMSIVQGVALGAFVISLRDSLGYFGCVSWILAATTFILIILTWNEYVIGVAIFKWNPTLLDSIIPFLFCITEVWLAFNISDNPQMWLFGFSFFSLVAFFAYLNMYHRAKKFKVNEGVIEELKTHHTWVKILTFITAILAFIFAVLHCYVNSPTWNLLTSAFISILVVIFIIRTLRYYRKLIDIADMKHK